MSKQQNEKLEIIRHSTSHVMAEAVLKLFPGSKVAIGPSIDNGFYYDFELTRPITQEDIPLIEKEMRKIVSEPHAFERREVSREEALKMFADQPYKVELINDLPEDAQISVYNQGDFTDFLTDIIPDGRINCPTIGMPKNFPGIFFIDMKQIQFLTQFSVIPSFSLCQHIQIVL